MFVFWFIKRYVASLFLCVLKKSQLKTLTKQNFKYDTFPMYNAFPCYLQKLNEFKIKSRMSLSFSFEFLNCQSSQPIYPMIWYLCSFLPYFDIFFKKWTYLIVTWISKRRYFKPEIYIYMTIHIYDFAWYSKRQLNFSSAFLNVCGIICLC